MRHLVSSLLNCWWIGPIFSGCALGGDWPQFLGPARNGVSAETNLSEAWPKSGPPVVWQKTIGQGFSGPVVASGKLILFHRVNDRETIDCLEAKTGKPLWQFAYPTQYQDDFGFDEGPRAVPAIAQDKIYTFGAEGMLHCLELTSGKKSWQVDVKSRMGAGKGYFGMTCSPLVEGNGVLLNVGGRAGAGIVALDKASGALLWKATEDEASCSSPVAATIRGQRYAAFFTRNGLVLAEPGSGKVVFQFPWRARMQASVNAATPLVVDDFIFLSASYQTGGIVLQVTDNGLNTVWSGDDILSNHYATCVYLEGYLYGFDGRQEEGCSFRCVEFKTGKVRWSKDRFGAGTVTLAGKTLIILKDSGELTLAAASPRGFETKRTAQILGAATRAYPAFADGHFYARDKKKLVCVELR